MKVQNPEYEQAPFELTYVGLDGKQMPDMMPLRFAAKDVSKAMELMQAQQWIGLRRLSVAPYLMVIQEIPVTQKQIDDVLEAIQ